MYMLNNMIDLYIYQVIALFLPFSIIIFIIFLFSISGIHSFSFLHHHHSFSFIFRKSLHPRFHSILVLTLILNFLFLLIIKRVIIRQHSRRELAFRFIILLIFIMIIEICHTLLSFLVTLSSTAFALPTLVLELWLVQWIYMIHLHTFIIIVSLHSHPLTLGYRLLSFCLFRLLFLTVLSYCRFGFNFRKRRASATFLV